MKALTKRISVILLAVVTAVAFMPIIGDGGKVYAADPNAPTNVAVNSVTGEGIEVTWSKPSGATNSYTYEVWR